MARPGEKQTTTPDEGQRQGGGDNGELVETDVAKMRASPPAPADPPVSPPVVYTISANAVQRRPVTAEQLTVSFGASREQSDIQLFDSHIGQRQIVAVNLGSEWVLADCGTRDLVHADGVATRQVVVGPGTRTVVSAGSSSVVFAFGEAGGRTGAARWPGQRRWRRGEEALGPVADATLTVAVDGNTFESAGQAILDGAHELCDIRLEGTGVHAFHALLYWSVEGIMVRRLVDGELRLGEADVAHTAPVPGPSAGLTVGDKNLTIRQRGDCAAAARARTPVEPIPFENFGLTLLSEPAEPAFVVPAYGGTMDLGRSRQCDLIIPDSGVSRVHAQIIPSGKTFYLIDNYSSNGTFVNEERTTKQRCRAGDLVEFGDVGFVVHYA